MDYEREPDSGVGGSPDQSEASVTTDDAATAAHDADQGATAEVADVTSAVTATSDAEARYQHEMKSDSDLGTDADVLDDSFATGPNPPEWPAADFVMGDDSDAPIVSDAAFGADTTIVADTAAAPSATPAPDAHIRADNVNITQGGVQSIEASTVTINQGGAGQVRADELNIEQGGVGIARVKTLNLGDGASAFAIVANEATVEEGSNTFLVVSRSVNGQVRAAVDWRAALAFGAGFGLVISILRRLR